MNNIPKFDVPVLARMNKGLTTWFDVLVFCKGNVWNYQFDLSHLTNNETVIDWVYCENVDFSFEFDSIPKETEIEKEFCCEEYECVTKFLDKEMVVKELDGNELSLVGRIKLYAGTFDHGLEDE